MKPRIVKLLKEALANVGLDEASGLVAVSYPNQEEFGDYSTNIALILAKKYPDKFSAGPEEVFALLKPELVRLDSGELFGMDGISFASGFINFSLQEKYLTTYPKTILKDGLSLVNPENKDQTIVVEYFQNNVAKPPHIGHLRSAVIGDSLVRILRAQGYKVISDTHVGDWGVQFGILLYAYKNFGNAEVVEADPIEELNKLYVEMSAKIEEDPSLRDLCKAEFKKLEDGDEENRKLWQWFVDESIKDFDRYKSLLGLLPFDYNLGESFYEEHMAKVLEEFKTKGLVVTGETGEKYVDLESYKLGRCILVKSDGATTYHLRDFATYLYRKSEFNFTKNIYVVDDRQSHHFSQLFKVLELAGYSANQDSIHVNFGFMSLPEGAISTRKGAVISLSALFAEADTRALAIIKEKNPDLENKEAVAREVATAAIKYFDLSHNRKTEIIFNWDQALAFEGNTGPYLQYTHARIRGILRKANRGSYQGHDGYMEPELVLVLRALAKYKDVNLDTIAEFSPNLLCNYLFSLAVKFNSFYEAVPVNTESDDIKRNFLLDTCEAVAITLADGLSELGISAPEEM